MPLYLANHATKNKNAEHSDHCTLCFCHFSVPNDPSKEPSSIKSMLASGKDTSSLCIDASLHFGGLGDQIQRTVMYNSTTAPSTRDPEYPDIYAYYPVYDSIDALRTVCVPYAAEWHGKIADGDSVAVSQGFNYLGRDDNNTNNKMSMNLKNCRIGLSFRQLSHAAYDLQKVQFSTVASMLCLDMKFADFMHTEMMRTIGEEVLDEVEGGNACWKFPLYFPGCTTAFTIARERSNFTELLNGRSSSSR